ncbi:MAG: hypothetical protein ACOYVK_03655 [Bacillota bacterium]
MKIRSILTTKRGSTLVMVLMALSVLSILGLSVLSLSVVNFRMKIFDKNHKISFYLTESGLEEAKALIGKRIEIAILAGNDEVKNKLDQLITQELEKEEVDKLDDDPNTNYDSPYLKADGTVDEAAVKPLMEKWFRVGYAESLNVYINNINDNTTDPDKNDFTKDITITVDSNINSQKAKVSLVGTADGFVLSGEPDVSMTGGEYDTANITLKSDFTHNGAQRILQTTIAIKVAQYNAPYFVKNVQGTINDNILFHKAITTENDVEIKGQNVGITGDVYAYGSSIDNGGMIIGSGGNSGNLTMNGNLFTRGTMRIDQSDSTSIISGDIYCDSVTIDNGINRAIITINGTVNTKDDLVLNGTQSSISIIGSYFGFSDGGGIATTHDNSSSIVINSSDIGTGGSTLSISGNVFIGGTVYIGVDEAQSPTGGPYQSGESVSIKGNYVGYTELINLVDDTATAEDESEFNGSVKLVDYPPLMLVRKNDDTDLTAIEKSRYIYYYDKQFPNRLNFGGGGISLPGDSNILFSTGAYMRSRNLFPSKIDISRTHYFSDKSQEFRKAVDYMGDPLESERIYIHNAGSGHKGKFSFLTNIADMNTSKKELVFVNNDSTKTIALIGPDGSNSDLIGDSDVIIYNLDDLDLNTTNDETIKGIIITKGDVILRGKLNYYGTIIAEKDINFQDSKTKRIVHDENFIYKKVYDTQNLRDQFVNNGSPFTFLYSTEARVDDIESYIVYEDLMKIRWDIIQ